MSILDGLNDKQREAAMHTEGPLLILAGAGSGKTRVLTYRTAYLIDEMGVSPWNIMAITFTNKAAREMRERINAFVSGRGGEVWVGTFHATCVRILRRFIDRIGYENNFTIYDADDQRTVMNKIFKQLDVDTRAFKVRAVLGEISSAKEKCIDEKMYAEQASDFREQKIEKMYVAYEEFKRKNNALDFDDLLQKTVELFDKCPDVLEVYQNRFRYIMVDEYQDTNAVQFRFVAQLARKNKNLCVVGDDDQSIYKFRGADITNILNFEKVFADTMVVKLEENYRSTANILSAANAVIRNNVKRKDKTLWTSSEKGEKIDIVKCDTAYDEAMYIVDDIKHKAATGDYDRYAILYRTNAQSRALEEQCVLRDVPYRLVGVLGFYQRKEIKDMLAYLKTIANGSDDLAAIRIINVPKRKIGATSIDKITSYAMTNGLGFFSACLQADRIASLGSTSQKVEAFASIIMSLREEYESSGKVSELIKSILEKTAYEEELKEEGEIEAKTRMDNIEELINKAIELEKSVDLNKTNSATDEMGSSADTSLLDRFLEEIALVTDNQADDEDQKRVTLMTLHSAKGLEFDEVYISGMEDGLFPSEHSIWSNNEDDLEEERRLAYVGITRARKKLTLTYAQSRMINGETKRSVMSRFVKEIPPELTYDVITRAKSNSSLADSFDDYDARFDKSYDGRDSYDSYRGEYSSGYNRGGYGSRRSDYSGTSYGNFGDYSSTGYKASSRGGSAKKTTNVAANYTLGKKIEKADHLDYEVGSRVSHTKFGAGTVASIKDGGRDYEVTVNFDSGETKKMFAGFAKLSVI